MKVLFDTNVLIDVLQNRAEFFEESFFAFQAVADEKIEGLITATTITDIAYIMRKYLQRNEMFDIVHKIITLFTICGVNKEDILYALSLDMSDFEDAVQASCAHRYDVDFIVTRDADGFTKSPVQAKSPRELIAVIV